MRKSITIVVSIAILLIAKGPVSLAYADEKPSPLQTELNNTTISGCSSADVTILDVGSTAGASAISASFSVAPVPEPSTISLFAAGTVAVVVLIARSRRRS